MNPGLDTHSIILALPTLQPVIWDYPQDPVDKLRVPARPAGGRDLLRQLTAPIGSLQDVRRTLCAVHWFLGIGYWVLDLTF